MARNTSDSIEEYIKELLGPVSYTHLDVYKRQVPTTSESSCQAL